MPGDLVIADSTFSTSQVFPEAGEVVAAAWARALAGNTGWLAFQPEPLPGAHGTTVAAEGTTSTTSAAFITAGTWVATAEITASSGDEGFHGTYLVDGSTVIGSASAANGGTMFGTGTFIQDASGWLTITMIGKDINAASPRAFSFAGFYRPCAE